jgi:hypothetical protein
MTSIGIKVLVIARIGISHKRHRMMHTVASVHHVHTG